MEVSALQAAGAVAAAALPAAATWWAARRKGKSDDQTAQAALLEKVQSAARDMIEGLETRVQSLQTRVDSVEAQLTQERNAWREERHRLLNELAAAEARAQLAERSREEAAGERRQLQQVIDSLTRRLRELGVDVPAPGWRASEPLLLGDPTA